MPLGVRGYIIIEELMMVAVELITNEHNPSLPHSIAHDLGIM